MNKITFVGDCHARWDELKNIVNRSERPVIQLGDMGVGFGVTTEPVWPRSKLRFIRGNHDSPADCDAHPNYMGDYGFDAETGVFYVSGAWSIDWERRTPGVNWWFDEELSREKLRNMLSLAAALAGTGLVKAVVTHDCPSYVFPELIADANRPSLSRLGYVTTRTALALDSLFRVLEPKIWLFGHHHVSRTIQFKGTTFRCLNILESTTIDLS